MKRFFSIMAIAMGLASAATPAAAAPILTFSASSTQIAVGDTVTIDATLSGLGDEILSAFDLNFIYNPAVLSFVSNTYAGAVLGTSLGLADNGLPPGDLGYTDTSLVDDAILAASQDNSFTLFSFTMKGEADGSTSFTLGTDPDFQRNFVGLNFESIAVDVGSVCIAVGTGSCDRNDVPEPESYLLAAVALLSAGVARRNRRILRPSA